jgi:hypothetical protein
MNSVVLLSSWLMVWSCVFAALELCKCMAKYFLGLSYFIFEIATVLNLLDVVVQGVMSGLYKRVREAICTRLAAAAAARGSVLLAAFVII